MMLKIHCARSAWSSHWTDVWGRFGQLWQSTHELVHGTYMGLQNTTQQPTLFYRNCILRLFQNSVWKLPFFGVDMTLCQMLIVNKAFFFFPRRTFSKMSNISETTPPIRMILVSVESWESQLATDMKIIPIGVECQILLQRYYQVCICTNPLKLQSFIWQVNQAGMQAFWCGIFCWTLLVWLERKLSQLSASEDGLLWPNCAVLAKWIFVCSDITNTLVGISGETAPVAGISCFIEYTVVPSDKRWF